MEINEKDIIDLVAVRERINATIKAVKRKRKIRQSERAMWLVDLQGQADTVSRIIATGSFELAQKGGSNV